MSDRDDRTVDATHLLDDGDDARFRAMLRSMMLFAQKSTAINERVGRQIGVGSAQYILLSYLVRLEPADSPTVGEIASEFGLTMPTITASVNKLVAEGYVEKAPHPTDGRSIVVCASAAGRAAVSDLAPLLREINEITFAGLTRDEFEVMAGVFDRLRGTLDLAINHIDGRDMARKLRKSA